jgi:DNA polymerase-3 subunit beta
MNTDKKINLESKEQTQNVRGERFQANIKGTSPEEFPLIPQVKEQNFISIPSNVLEEAIRETIVAVAMDETRPALSGIYFKIDGSKLKLVATDSYRLAEKIIPLESKVESQKAGIIIPAKTMQELLRILGAVSSEQVKISYSQNQIQFNIDKNIELVSRLIEGTFPNYEQIIPTNHQTKVSLDSSEFANGLKVANLFARESANNVKIQIKSPDKLMIKAVAGQVGDNLSQIGCVVEGSDSQVAFNGKFLLDALGVISSPKIDLEISGKLSAAVLRPADSKNYLYIIMPLRTEE